MNNSSTEKHQEGKPFVSDLLKPWQWSQCRIKQDAPNVNMNGLNEKEVTKKETKNQSDAQDATQETGVNLSTEIENCNCDCIFKNSCKGSKGNYCSKDWER